MPLTDPMEHTHSTRRNYQNTDGGQPVRDPVCGMEVVPDRAAGSVDHEGRTYYFCSRRCVERFRETPARFLAPNPHLLRSGTRPHRLCIPWFP